MCDCNHNNTKSQSKSSQKGKYNRRIGNSNCFVSSSNCEAAIKELAEHGWTIRGICKDLTGVMNSEIIIIVDPEY